ncbi:MAG: hypothetical protein V4638_10350 [Bacteroidota bacterium]
MRFILLLIGVFVSFTNFSQVGYSLQFTGDEIHAIVKKPKESFKDSISAIHYLRKIQNQVVSKGYLLASFDSISYQNRNIKVHFFKGPQLNQIQLNIKDDDLQFIKKGGIREKEIAKIPFQAGQISKLMKELLSNSLNSGYPFAQVKIENISYQNQHVEGDLILNKGQYYQWKEIHIKGDSVLSTSTISSLIGIHSGNKFKEADLNSISENLRQVNYLKIIKPYELLFTEEGVELFLYLESIPISSANGIIGLQPNTSTNKMSITGELNLKLVNLLRRSESMQIAWRSVRSGTQSLNLALTYPFLFKSPFGLDGNFQLYKRDSTFLETKTNFGIQYFLGRGSYIKAFYALYTSDLISTQTTGNQQSLKSSSYGMALIKKKIDYLPNPSRGYIVQLEGQVGQRKLTIPDSAEVPRNITSSLKLNLDWFINLGKRNILHVGTSFASYYAPAVYANELLRFGGLNSLRGFNEEELTATSFATATLEYRFLTDRNSHAFAFYNQSFYENRSGNYYNDAPFGFGIGYSFGTPIGIFSLSTALGKQFNNPILLRNSKIHFGYIAYF